MSFALTFKILYVFSLITTQYCLYFDRDAVTVYQRLDNI